MFSALLVAILFVACIEAQEDEAPDSNNKAECIKDFIQWCDDMEYKGHGISMMSLTYHDDAGYNRVFCSTDSEGSNCTRNGSPWFACTPDHTLSYKGQVLSDPEDDVDDEICKTVDKVHNELFLQKVSFDNTTMTKFHEELGSFFQEIAAMQAQIQQLQKSLGAPFMGKDFWNGFGNLFPSHPDTTVEAESDDNENPSKDANEIEKE